ncbi:SPFH domain-containing protein, partial [Streptomyces sp. SID11233]|nr:SPFH domain-containing protein [Streptomyces sp. SID11233]
MPKPRVTEFTAKSIGGGLALLLGLLGLVIGIGLVASATAVGSTGAKAALIVLGILLAIASIFAMAGLNMVAPGEARVVQLFGRYRGTIRT